MFQIQVNDRTFLRVLSLRDAEMLFQLTDQSRAYLKEWLPWIDQTKTIEDSKTFITTSLLGMDKRQSITTGIFYDHELIGVVGFNRLDHANKVGSIGYWLGEEYQGKGIMTKAVESLIDYGFHELQLNRIEIACATENKKSQYIPKRLHFTEEACVREAEWLYDRFVDHYVYTMLASEWQTLSTEKSENS